MIRTIALTCSLVFAGMACSSSPDDDLVFEVDGGKEDGLVRPWGTWERQLADGEGGFYKLELNDDRTYVLTTRLTECNAGPCPEESEDRGTFRWARSNGKRLIVMYDENGDLLDKLEWVLDGETVRLRFIGTAKWFTFGAVLGLVLDESDNGATYDVSEGDDVIVKLKTIPSSGYSWHVITTGNTLGDPEESYADDGLIGAEGLQTFTWHTTGAVSLIGAHSVTLDYKRSWEQDVPPLATFSFTVNVVP
jgi:predicted secreted protein